MSILILTYLDTATMELEYCLFVSDSEITLTSHSQDLVKEELEKHTDESNIKKLVNKQIKYEVFPA